jgi:hypothetical protein
VQKFFASFRGRTNVHNLAVIDTEGKVIYQWDTNAPTAVDIPSNAKQVFGPVKTFSSDGLIWLTSAVQGRNAATVNHVLVSIKQNTVFEQVIEASKEQLLKFGLITLAVCLLFAALLFVGVAMVIRSYK